MSETCSTTFPDGTQCRNRASRQGFCYSCWRTQQGRQGYYGLKEDFHGVYDEFRGGRHDFTPQDEIALNRTILLRVIEGLEKRTYKTYEKFIMAFRAEVVMDLTFFFDMPEAQAQGWADRICRIVKNPFEEIIGTVGELSIKDARGITDIVAKITKSLETWKKIEEERVITVEIDEELLAGFLRKITRRLPPVYRKLVVEDAASFSYGKIDGVSLPPDEVYEGEVVGPETTALVPVEVQGG